MLRRDGFNCHCSPSASSNIRQIAILLVPEHRQKASQLRGSKSTPSQISLPAELQRATIPAHQSRRSNAEQQRYQFNKPRRCHVIIIQIQVLYNPSRISYSFRTYQRTAVHAIGGILLQARASCSANEFLMRRKLVPISKPWFCTTSPPSLPFRSTANRIGACA